MNRIDNKPAPVMAPNVATLASESETWANEFFDVHKFNHDWAKEFNEQHAIANVDPEVLWNQAMQANG